MMAPAFLVLLGSLAAAPSPAAAQPASPAYAAVPAAGEWMRLYPLRQYGAYWHLELSVRKYVKGRKGVLKILDQAGARYTVPIELSAADDKRRYQQLSVEVDRSRGGKALEKLKKLGKVGRATQADNPLPEVEREVPVKLARLRAEGRDGLGDAPASRAAIDEIMAHLEAVQAAYESSRDRVLLNIVVEGEQ